ncbi:hypothetical protein DFP73DRAFT_616137 [Morchella snyderi]|nr:hypothetical protein DFP73DRAFT_616137 [Morchella snyderi]
MSKYEYKSNYKNQLDEWAQGQEAWSKDLNQRLEELEEVAGPSSPPPLINPDEQQKYWGPNILNEWTLDAHDSSGLHNSIGEQHIQLPNDPVGTLDGHELFSFWLSENQEMITSTGLSCQQQPSNDNGESQYQGIPNPQAKSQQGELGSQHLGFPNDTGASKAQGLPHFWKNQNKETIKSGGSQQKLHNLGESSQELQVFQNNHLEALKGFDGRQQEPIDLSELNEPWNGDLPSPASRHKTAESNDYTSTVSDHQSSPKPIDLEKYLPYLGATDEILTPEELKQKLQFQDDVLTMHRYNQRLAEQKSNEEAGIKSKDKGMGKAKIQNSLVYNPAIHKFDPSTTYARPSNKKKRFYYEISDDDEEPGQQRLQSRKVGEKQEPPKQQVRGVTFEEFRTRFIKLDPNVQYTLREGEQEPSSKRVKMSSGGRPVRPPKEDPRWNIWTVGNPNLRLKGSNISADYLRTVLFEDAGATGERRTKWSLVKLCERLDQRREYRDKEARRLGLIRAYGKPKNWDENLEWWNYFDDV